MVGEVERTAIEGRAAAQQWNVEWRDRPAEALLGWVARTFGRDAVLTCSFGGAAGMVLLDMVVRARLPVAVLFLDTGLLFPETYALVEDVERHYGITITRQHPALSVAEQDAAYGAALYARDPDRCCGIRKVAPLSAALAPYRAWISGIRRDQTSERAATEPIVWSGKHNLLKVSPLASWDERAVWRYINANSVPYNVLLDQGYPSIGCVPCTSQASAENPRGGRWSGSAKTECGIHL
jgi:phosphoadenosine phosphosulfate reductase